MPDVLREIGPRLPGSRLKRLAERVQAGAARILADAGLAVQPSHMPLLTALDRGPMTIGQLGEEVGSSQPGVTRASASSSRSAWSHRRAVPTGAGGPRH